MTVSLLICITSSQCSYREGCKCRSNHLTRYILLIVLRFCMLHICFRLFSLLGGSSLFYLTP